LPATLAQSPEIKTRFKGEWNERDKRLRFIVSSSLSFWVGGLAME